MNENQNVKNEETSREISQTVTQLINELLTATAPSCSSQPSKIINTDSIIENSSELNYGSRKDLLLDLPQIHPYQKEAEPTVEIYRGNQQFYESLSDFEVRLGSPQPTQTNAVLTTIDKHPPPPSVPPSYSTVIKQGRPSLDLRRDARSMELQHISPFNRMPPPSYGEIQGAWSTDFSTSSSEQIMLGPDPIYIWCTRCATVVITTTESQRSKFTHLTAAALCLFGCWPCAMLPYCMSSCKNIYHYCPECNYQFGMYRPW